MRMSEQDSSHMSQMGKKHLMSGHLARFPLEWHQKQAQHLNQSSASEIVKIICKYMRDAEIQTFYLNLMESVGVFFLIWAKM